MTKNKQLIRKVLKTMLYRIMEPIDKFIDGITMYRLLMYYLIGILLAAIGLSATNVIHYSAPSIAVSATILVFACWIINKIFAAIFDAPTNPESSILTGLILSLIVPPSPSGTGLLFLLAVSGLAIASKYILTIRRKHIFNPAAIAVVLTALGPRQNASWWVGTATLVPFVLIGGILVMRKVRSEHMVFTFLIATTIATAGLSLATGGHLGLDLKNMILNSAVLFLGFVMLTEPYTSPTTRNKQLWYAIIVGVIMAPQVHVGSFYSTPEIALVLGNLYAYISGSKVKLFPTLFRKYKIAEDTAEFAFVPGKKLDYKPGQYMEFTLPHEKSDSRGARRYFTLSSSPTEDHLKIGVRFYDNGSSYKSALLDIDQNSSIVASQLAGDFVLPEDPTIKLCFVAGGIGITPFRSMIKYLIDTADKRDIVLLYSVRRESFIAYKSFLKEAEKAIGLKYRLFVTDTNAKVTDENIIKGRIDEVSIKRIVPDIQERTIFISGTHHMVESVQESLHLIGTNHANIKIDFFPGYA